jgi:hypothetical protein
MRANDVLLKAGYATEINAQFADLQGETIREINLVATKVGAAVWIDRAEHSGRVWTADPMCWEVTVVLWNLGCKLPPPEMKKFTLFAAFIAGTGILALIYRRLRSRKTSSNLGLAVARFPLSSELSSLHDDVIQYSSDIHASFDEHSPMSTYALANVHYTAILCHRGIRELCEQGWALLSSVLLRTMLDHIINCIAITAVPKRADYMGFKYFAPLFLKLSTDPIMTDAERQRPK